MLLHGRPGLLLVYLVEKQANPMKTLAISFVLILSASPLMAKQPLHENPTVISGFYAIGLADEVRKNCSSIGPRMIRAYNYLRALHGWAKDNGYTDAEIEELVDNRKEKEALRARIRADLKDRGASPQTPEGYCTVGREEIAKETAAGRLLRAN